VTRSLLALLAALALALTACGGSADEAAIDDVAAGDDTTTEADGDMSGDTSMPADPDHTAPDGEDRPVSPDEAEVVARAYIGLSEAAAEEQAAIDGRPYRVGEKDGEGYMLTEDYVMGRITVTITDGVVTAATVEADGGPVTVTN
jgi:hypothetical protein